MANIIEVKYNTVDDVLEHIELLNFKHYFMFITVIL